MWKKYQRIVRKLQYILKGGFVFLFIRTPGEVWTLCQWVCWRSWRVLSPKKQATISTSPLREHRHRRPQTLNQPGTRKFDIWWQWCEYPENTITVSCWRFSPSGTKIAVNCSQQKYSNGNALLSKWDCKVKNNYMKIYATYIGFTVLSWHHTF